MQELIKIEKSRDGKDTVSARALYEFLEVRTEFSKWCSRMFEYGMEDGKDYQKVIVKNDDNQNGGRSTLIDYALTLDTAKEISMIQRSEKGKIARKYFIECERRLSIPQKVLPSNYKEALMALVAAEEEKEELLELVMNQQEKLERSERKVLYHDAILRSTDLIPISIIAKELGTSAKELNKKLNLLGIQYQIGTTWVLYAKYQNMDFTGTKTIHYTDTNGNEHCNIHTYWTQRGRKFIHLIYNNKKIEASLMLQKGASLNT